ncbi:carbohydrate kinase family protein [Agromyces kandeliae]|uniref:Carbohydrate kinase n=1 Tax=Agromyces kandeliae TaxID=2666141 RepID=A0A6L5R425_9MICO|nr:carbohydrate kinase family protein [Agromyces kandeliae]MRX44753.1 carbohydrate kinase [Agromyces kandeliae]
MAGTPAALNRLLVVGELCVDLIVELGGSELRFGQHEQIVGRTTMTMGSSSAITACGAAALGVPTTLVSVCGPDTFGSYLISELERRGVDPTHVRIDETMPTGASTHLTRPDGDRAILTSMGSIGTVVAADVPEPLLEGAAHLHVGSYFLQGSLQADARALFARARELGATTSLDGNFDPSERWDGGILDALREVDILFGNDQELRGITGASSMDAAMAAALDAMPPGAIVVGKLGADGAIAERRIDGRSVRVIARPPVVDAPLVDTVGAGDTLAAGFLAATIRGASTEDALAFAVACGTASTRGAGGVGAQPGIQEAERLAALVEVDRAEA